MNGNNFMVRMYCLVVGVVRWISKVIDEREAFTPSLSFLPSPSSWRLSPCRGRQSGRYGTARLRLHTQARWDPQICACGQSLLQKFGYSMRSNATGAPLSPHVSLYLSTLAINGSTLGMNESEFSSPPQIPKCFWQIWIAWATWFSNDVYRDERGVERRNMRVMVKKWWGYRFDSRKCNCLTEEWECPALLVILLL